MSALGLKQVDEFVFAPRYKSELQVLLLDADLARSIFSDFFKQYSPSKEVIADNVKLASFHEHIHKRIKYEQPRRKLGSYISGLMDAVSVSETGFSFSLGGLLTQQAPCAAPITLPSLVIIHEDDISSERLSAFFSLFKQVDPQYCPAFIFVSNVGESRARSMLAACGEEIDVLTLTPGGTRELALEAEGADSFSQFLEFFMAEADGTCVASDPSHIDLSGEDRGNLGELAIDMLRIQSLFRQGRKFDGRQQIQSLEKRVLSLKEATSLEGLQKEYLYVRAMLDLWYVFVTEDSRDKIQNAISIADHLGDEVLLAHALKQIDMLHGYGELTRQQLMRAKQVFVSRGETEQSLFVENNAIVNDLYMGTNCVDTASRMSDFVHEMHPHIRRSTTIHSNAGIANLVKGREQQSFQHFERAINGSGPPVNKLTSEMNHLIARYVDGEALDASEAERFMRKMERSNIPDGFDYHQTTMLANLWKIFEKDRSTSDAIVQSLRSARFMPYQDFLDSPDRLLRHVMSSYGDFDGSNSMTRTGSIEAFFERHGLWLSAHVFYR